MRHARQMRYDDTTLLLLRVMAEAPAAVDSQQHDSGSADCLSDELDIENWSKSVKSVSGEVSERVEQLSENVIGKMKMLKEKAMQKYREKFGPDKK